ncbi:MAG: recombination protein RecR [Gemmatimonadetes bacterium]|nr:recombination protein RecR [Gemmatimonadota bacterium]
MPSFWATWCWPPSPRRSAGPRSCCRARCGRCRRSRSRRPSDVSAIDDLIAELARLPGIGRKTAQRLTFHLLQQTSDQATRLAATLVAVAERVRACEECGNLTEEQPCAICRDPRRDAGVLCVVEEASTVAVVDRSTDFRGRYHVLGGRLSPLEGIGPESLRIDRLLRRVEQGGVREIILATNPSMEGEVTATYIQQLLAGRGLRVTRLARGLPMGGDLEYVDGVTLAHALTARQEVP